MKAHQRMIVGLAIGITMAVASTGVHAGCKSVQGRIVSELVEEFSDGTPCPSTLDLCTEGRFTGRLKGHFTFVAASLTPYTGLDPSAPPDVASTTGGVILNSKICSGSLVLDDTSTFSLSADGSVAGIETINSTESTGDCSGATGRFRYTGIFEGGCVDCKYKGEVCINGNGDEEDEEEDDN